MKTQPFVLLFLACCLFLPFAASAQTNNAGDNPAQLENRLTAMEEEIRSLRGKLEEDDFQIHKLSDNLDKAQKDTSFRLDEIEHNKPGGAAATPGTPPPSATEGGGAQGGELPTAAPERHVIPGNPPAEQTGGGGGVLKLPSSESNNADGEELKTNFTTSHEHYNYAFRLLNQTQYDQAAKTFDDFTKKYPKDPLIGNAWYWEGETYYIRRDYAHAADDFRQGFEALPEGPKASDNLLKLAMSLDALGRDKEACVVLQQIGVKFGKSSVTVADKASQEQKRIGCQ